MSPVEESPILELPPVRYPALWLPDLQRTSAPSPEWLWHGFAAPGHVTLMTSQWKTGKTTLLAMLLDRLKSGGRLAGLPVRAGRAVVVSEEAPQLWHHRSTKFDFDRHVCWLCRPFAGKPTAPDWLNLLSQVGELQRERNLQLAVFDALAAFLPSGAENHAGTMIEALQPLQRLAESGLSVLVLHHTKKGAALDGQSSRGSGALPACVDILIEMHWHQRAAEADRRRRLLAWSRYEDTPRQLVIELNETGTDYKSLGDFAEEEFTVNWQTLLGVLVAAERKLTWRTILDRWPDEAAKPDDGSLRRWLLHGFGSGKICREGTGRRGDPHRYWLPGREPNERMELPELGELSPLQDLSPLRRDSAALSEFDAVAQRDAEEVRRRFGRLGRRE
jgi:hypothetical protein